MACEFMAGIAKEHPSWGEAATYRLQTCGRKAADVTARPGSQEEEQEYLKSEGGASILRSARVREQRPGGERSGIGNWHHTKRAGGRAASKFACSVLAPVACAIVGSLTVLTGCGSSATGPSPRAVLDASVQCFNSAQTFQQLRHGDLRFSTMRVRYTDTLRYSVRDTGESDAAEFTVTRWRLKSVPTTIRYTVHVIFAGERVYVRNSLVGNRWREHSAYPGYVDTVSHIGWSNKRYTLSNLKGRRVELISSTGDRFHLRVNDSNQHYSGKLDVWTSRGPRYCVTQEYDRGVEHVKGGDVPSSFLDVFSRLNQPVTIRPPYQP